MSSPRVALITGCSSGVGRALALLLAKERPSYTVYATMRSPNSEKGKSLKKEAEEKSLSNLRIRALDVCSDTSVNDLIKTLVEEHSTVDVVINNAGFAVNGTHEMCSMDAIQKQFETNVFGVCRLNAATLPLMRAKKSGHTIVVSSVGGILGVPFNDYYCSSKFAVEGLYESMSSMNSQLGISTSIVEPAGIKTDFMANAELPKDEDVPDSLTEVFQKYKKVMIESMTGNTAQTPDQVAEVIMQAIADGETNSAKLRYQTSPTSAAMVAAKLTDPTGNSLRDASTKRFFS